MPGVARRTVPEYRQKSAASQEALRRETDFAFKQAFAFCPYSPEAVFRYINFLLQYGRFEDALTVATTCQKLDPFNDQISNTVAQLKSYQKQNAERTQAMGEVDTMENIARTNPGNIPNLIRLGGTYLVMTQTNRGVEVLNEAINSSNITYPDATIAAQYFGQLGDIPAFQHALERMVVLAPDQPDPRFHLAEVMAVTGHPTEALQNLQMAITLSRKQSGGNTIAAQAMSDPNLNSLHSLPDFQKIVAGN